VLRGQRDVVAAARAGGRPLVLRGVYAAMLIADGDSAPAWQAAQVNCGLPLRDRARFEPVETMGCVGNGPVLIGGIRGVYRSADAYRWSQTANRETTEMVTIPDTWLLCSGEHRIEVVRADATPSD